MSTKPFVSFHVDRDLAILSGNNEYGAVKVPIDLSKLTKEEREILLSCPSRTFNNEEIFEIEKISLENENRYIQDYLPKVKDSSLDSIKTILSARKEAVQKFFTDFQKKVDEGVAKVLQAKLEDLISSDGKTAYITAILGTLDRTVVNAVAKNDGVQKRLEEARKIIVERRKEIERKREEYKRAKEKQEEELLKKHEEEQKRRLRIFKSICEKLYPDVVDKIETKEVSLWSLINDFVYYISRTMIGISNVYNESEFDAEFRNRMAVRKKTTLPPKILSKLDSVNTERKKSKVVPRLREGLEKFFQRTRMSRPAILDTIFEFYELQSAKELRYAVKIEFNVEGVTIPFYWVSEPFDPASNS